MQVKTSSLRVRIREQALLARMAAWILRSPTGVALVWGSTIYLWGASREQLLQNQRWLRHELAHVQQYRSMGICTFLCYYLWYSVRFGYKNNPLEVAARQKEKEPVDFDSFEII